MAEFRWFGHNCFRIRSKEATIVLDPLNRTSGYAMQKQTADIVTISHDHPGHSNLAAIKPEFKVIKGPGEYEMSGVFVTGTRTWHDEEKGARLGFNTAYVIEAEGMRFCHLGDLGHALTAAQVELLEGSDVLMIPVGGGDVLTPVQAAEVVATLDPKIVVPMQFATSKGDKNLESIEAFCKALGVAAPVAEDKLTVKQSELPGEMRVVVLNPESEATK